MDEFARRTPEDRRAFLAEAATQRDLTPLIVEKDFWVCWTLRRLVRSEKLAGHMTFKGGTSLSKAYGVIARFSEDIDLTIRRSAPLLEHVLSPMDDDLAGKERQRRTRALKEAAQAYTATIAMPALASAIEAALGTAKGWSIEPDPEDPAGQTLLFNYPRTTGWGNDYGNGWGGGDGGGYIQPRIKLELGARGDPEPYEVRSIRPYVADAFPDIFADADTLVETLSVERTYWEKATILHALHHNGKLREGMSRHYYDLLMLDRAGVTQGALADADLLRRVVHNKSLMFADPRASYETADLATLRLLPSAEIEAALARDYAAMAEMFMDQPPTLRELLDGLGDLERRINEAAI